MPATNPEAAPRPVVACLHHAGGTTACFAGWDVPGARVRRIGYRAGSHVDLAQLARGIAEALATVSHTAVLYGHSMGAVLAYEAALYLQDAGFGPAAVVLAASHSPDPRTRPRTSPRLRVPPPGKAAAVLEEDLALLDRYWGREATPTNSLRCPVLLVAGSEDDVVSPHDVWDWARWCRKPPERLVVQGGGHLFHRRNKELPRAIARYIP